MTMITNDSIICVSNNDQIVDLICEVIKVEGQVLYCSVINGGWSIQFDLETGQCLPTGQYQIRHILPDTRGHYNTIMGKVDKLIQNGLDYNVKTNIEVSLTNHVSDWEDTIPF